MVAGYIQSIIGATEKRRESGAGVALAADIGNLESVRLGGGGVYQDWGDGARESEYRQSALFKVVRKCRSFHSMRVPIAHIVPGRSSR